MILALTAFLVTYTVNMLYTSVFYHRGFTHRAVKLGPKTRKFVVSTGNWVTGVDPLTWICMHRIHHRFSDTEKDPHSPRNGALYKVIWMQLISYGKTLDGLLKGNIFYTKRVKDLGFPVCWLNRTGLWFLPHLLHTVIGVAIGYFYGLWWVGFAYWFGIMSHPIQGWFVNALGHSHGYRTYNTKDASTNNLFVGWFVMGEGYQNNHHYRPRAANFQVKWWEMDLGYVLCLIAEFFGMIKIRRRD